MRRAAHDVVKLPIEFSFILSRVFSLKVATFCSNPFEHVLVVPGCLSANKIQYLCTMLLTFERLLAFIYVVLHLFQDIGHHDCTLYYLMIFLNMYVILFF